MGSNPLEIEAAFFSLDSYYQALANILPPYEHGRFVYDIWDFPHITHFENVFVSPYKSELYGGTINVYLGAKKGCPVTCRDKHEQYSSMSEGAKASYDMDYENTTLYYGKYAAGVVHAYCWDANDRFAVHGAAIAANCTGGMPDAATCPTPYCQPSNGEYWVKAWFFGRRRPVETAPIIKIVPGTRPRPSSPGIIPILAGAALLLMGIWLPATWDDLEVQEGKVELTEGNLQVNA